ncbi:MAG: hypothetical protein CFH44_01167 [Proteobacteria bacterium]|nr:MAG: hypothetical protein CFH44_01167 [Pseudomonadota bacterium]|tara:strand:- start:2666 stop:2839 length:174 start_codon:yes stop_codon:yes gene_type:complete
MYTTNCMEGNFQQSASREIEEHIPVFSNNTSTEVEVNSRALGFDEFNNFLNNLNNEL